MTDAGKNNEFHLTQEEIDEEEKFEAAQEPRVQRKGSVRHGARFWCGVLAVVTVVVVGLIVLYPRKTPCHEQVVFEPTAGTRATLERCALPGQNGGVFYGTP